MAPQSGKGSTPGKAAPPSSSSSSYPSSTERTPRTLSLCSRPLDMLIAFWFVVFAFTTTFTDLHNFIASAKGVPVEALEGMTLAYPPRVLTTVYFRWGRTVDPLLYTNPVWWQCIEWVNMLVLTPFALVASIGFLRGWAWLRMPAVVVSSFTPYSLVLCMGTTM